MSIAVGLAAGAAVAGASHVNSLGPALLQLGGLLFCFAWLLLDNTFGDRGSVRTIAGLTVLAIGVAAWVAMLIVAPLAGAVAIAILGGIVGLLWRLTRD
jgi:hypothetical protein